VSITERVEIGLRRRGLGVFWFFAISGIGLSTWMARIPAIRDNLEVSTAEVGLFLLGGAAGALSGLSVSSHIVAYLGPKWTAGIFATLGTLAIGVVGIVSVVWPSLPLAIAVMVVFGIGTSITDVAINVEGADVEKERGRTIMPWFHGFFSLGTAVGGGLGAAVAGLGIGVEYHFPAVAIILLPAVAYATWLMGGERAPVPEDQPVERSTLKSRMAVWGEGRTLLVGIVALSMAFAEGSANDWLALGMVDDRGYTNAEAALWFVLFSGAMTLGRFIGPPFIDRFGRVTILAASALSALIGLAIVILIDNIWFAGLAVIMWGLGSALGFPVAMSAAADDASNGPARVAAVATIAYAAFLIGPPLIGGIAELWGVLNALWVVAIIVAIGLMATPSTKKPGA